MKKIFEYKIGKRKYFLRVKGKIIKTKKNIIINKENNLIKDTSWNNKGYITKKILSSEAQSNIQKKIILYLKKTIFALFPGKDFSNFKLTQYHKFINKKEHYFFLSKLSSGIKFKDVGFNKKILESAVSKLLGIDVSTKNPYSNKINKNTFALRIIRPGKNDFNPPHKDIYLKRLKNGINIYLPIIGSNKLSSLPLLPKSHLFSEDEIVRTTNGAEVNKVKFRVPCIISCKSGLNLLRPNPKKSEILVFSPYLIHGGGSNDNKNTTRISLDLRFWTKKN